MNREFHLNSRLKSIKKCAIKDRLTFLGRCGLEENIEISLRLSSNHLSFTVKVLIIKIIQSRKVIKINAPTTFVVGKIICQERNL